MLKAEVRALFLVAQQVDQWQSCAIANLNFAPLRQQMTPLSPSETFGKICTFMATIPFYQVLPLIAIERRVASALGREQFIYFEDKQGRPAGYASWIWLTDDEEEEYLRDPLNMSGLPKEKLTAKQAGETAKLWIVDFCGRASAAPKIARHLRQRLAKDHPDLAGAKAVRWSKRYPFPFLRRYVTGTTLPPHGPGTAAPIQRKARLEDVYDLAPRMRWQDREEVRLNSGRNPFEALFNGYKRSRVSYAFEFYDRCIGMFGLADTGNEEGSGMIWLLSNDTLQDHPMFKARIGKKFVDEGLQIYPKLMNFVHEDSQQDTMEWLKFLGFEFTEADENHNQRGGKFWKFEKCWK
jgi:hemolysin-activating ACP:hemolysin acyltransferase